MQGPLQAFGNMQRALRDADKRLDALGQSQLQVATARQLHRRREVLT